MTTRPAERRSRFRLTPMRPRDPHERGRTASTLELFFDLVFVVAVSVASGQLHHALTEAHIVDGLAVYAVVFFGIWWAWMNFTWFATSFDTDDWLYRVLTIVQMGGVLVLAAGIEPAFTDENFTILILSYVVMRIAMVAQWLRASRAAGKSRRATRIYAIGIAVVQVFWLVQLAVPAPISWVVLVMLIGAELAIPIVAERIGSTPWHPHHITERYGLFTLILLGESLLASANAIIEALHTGENRPALIGISALTLITTAALWWIYFWPPHYRAISTFANSLRYGYVHYFVFAAAGALSAGIEIQIDGVTGHTQLSAIAAAFTLSTPIAVFILGIWWIALRQNADPVVNAAVPIGAILVLLAPLGPVPVVLTAGVLIAVVVVLVIRPPLDAAEGHAAR